MNKSPNVNHHPFPNWLGKTRSHKVLLRWSVGDYRNSTMLLYIFRVYLVCLHMEIYGPAGPCFLQVGCPPWHPTDSIEVLQHLSWQIYKEIRFTEASSFSPAQQLAAYDSMFHQDVQNSHCYFSFHMALHAGNMTISQAPCTVLQQSTYKLQ